MGILDSVYDAVSVLRQNKKGKQDNHRKFIEKEAKIGAKLFGPVPAGRNRSFFCLDRRTWIWHESWTNENGQKQQVTTRYTIHPTTIEKTQNDVQMPMTIQELETLTQAAKVYYPMVAQEVYGIRVPTAV